MADAREENLVSKKAFSSELERALARPDVKDLLKALHDHKAWGDLMRSDPKEAERREGEFDNWLIFERQDTDLMFALVALALNSYDDPDFLGLMAAGPLEDLLLAFTENPNGEWQAGSPSDEVFARVMLEAKLSRRYRWMLNGVYTTHLTSQQAKLFKKNVEKIAWDDFPSRDEP